jgi:hypothetical protein
MIYLLLTLRKNTKIKSFIFLSHSLSFSNNFFTFDTKTFNFSIKEFPNHNTLLT